MTSQDTQKAEIAASSGAPVLSEAMDAALKAKWIAALRSGEFKQGEGYLSLIEGEKVSYCCLGVALELQGAKWFPEPEGRATSFPRGCLLGGGSFKGNSLAKDLRTVFPDIDQKEIDRLMDMNDGGKSFSEIADYIEANIPAVDHSVSESSSDAISPSAILSEPTLAGAK